MEVRFPIDGEPAVFTWSTLTGGAELALGDEQVTLQRSSDLGTHFGLTTERTWRASIGSHEIEVAKTRPRLLAGLRKHTFAISVDGEVVATGKGR